jgi:hypothetical protein
MYTIGKDLCMLNCILKLLALMLFVLLHLVSEDDEITVGGIVECLDDKCAVPASL